MDKQKKVRFFSAAKGKCSVSTNICLLATYLSSIEEKKVLVISLNEGDRFFEELYFGRNGSDDNQAFLNNIGLTGLKRISEIRTIDTELVEKYSVRINKFLYILPGYEKEMSRQFIDIVLEASNTLFDYILIDAGFDADSDLGTDLGSNIEEKGFCTFICITQEENVIKSGIKIAYSGNVGKKAFIVSRYDEKSVYNLSNMRKIMKTFLRDGETSDDGDELVLQNHKDHIFSISYDTSILDYVSSGNLKGLSKNFTLMSKEKKRKTGLLSEMKTLSDFIEEG